MSVGLVFVLGVDVVELFKRISESLINISKIGDNWSTSSLFMKKVNVRY